MIITIQLNKCRFIRNLMRRSHLSVAHKLKHFVRFPYGISNPNSFSTNHSFCNLPSSQLLQTKDPITFAQALTLSSSLRSAFLGNQLHAQIIKVGFSNFTFLQNNLIVMYSKCGLLDCCYKVFDEMPEINVVSWTSIISGFIQNGKCEMGLDICLDMMRNGYQPNEFTLGSVMRGCISTGNMEFGLSVHCFALKIGIVSNYFVAGSVLHMYAKHGDVEAAEMVFECMDDCDVGFWNVMINCYALNGYSLKALEFLSLMLKRHIVMDQFTIMSAIKGCSLLGDPCLGKEIHGMIIRRKMAFDSSGLNSLIDMYFKIGRKDYALTVFDMLPNKDIVSWNTVLGELAHDGNAIDAASLFSSMLLKGMRPNHVTLLNLFKLSGMLLDLHLSFQLHSLAYRLGFFSEPVVANSLMEAFSRCGAYETVKSVFDSILIKDITTWNKMLLGYKLDGRTTEAVKLFLNLRELAVEANEYTFSIIMGALESKHQEIGMQIHGSIVRFGFSLHGFVCTSLISAYARFGLFDESYKIFNEIERLDLASWGAMVSSFVLGRHIYEALGILNRLIESGEKVDEFILASILNGCADITAYRQAKCIHSVVIHTRFEKNVCVASAIINAYAKCGDIESSRMTFYCSSRNDDAVLFNTMIMAYASHGLAMEAIEIFEEMKLAKLQPTHATFVSVISLCSHLGLVELGHRFFDSINLVHKMVPSAENFGSLIDLYSRNGFLEEAKHVIEVMPFAPWPAVWRSLLHGCRSHGNRKLGEWSSKQLLQLVPKSDAAYALLTNVYSQEGRWDDAANLGGRMLNQGVRKNPGSSWIEI